MYGPLVRWGLAVPQRLLTANLDRDELMAFYRDPSSDVSGYPASARAKLERIIIASHCDLIEASQVAPMLRIQQARDLRMGQALATAPAPALLIAGAYHGRRDLGVPLHWDGQWGAAPVVVLLSEAGSPLPGPEQADFVWLAPGLPEQDHCAGMRAAAES